MKSFALALCLLLSGAIATSTDSPVEKVVQLLTKLKTRILADGATEQQVYDKYACWCEKTTARKASTITTAKDDLRTLGQNILGLKGQVAVLAAEIGQLLTEIKANEEAQATATAIRQKENEAYMAESAEMQQALAALEQAIFVLKDATMPGAASLLQSTRGAAASVALQQASRQVQAVIAALPTGAALAPEKLSLLRRAASSLRAGSLAGYAPQSATVQGILQDMYTTFSSDLELATKGEATKNRDFEALIAVKQEELLAKQGIMRKKEAEKAEGEVMLAETVQSYDDTERQLKADIDFFDATTASCTSKSAEWKQRSALRAEELDGITKAIEILSTDDARELFGKAIKPGVAIAMLQVENHKRAAHAAPASPEKQRAYSALKAGASRVHSLRLARLAATVGAAKVGHFDKVIEAIDAMVRTLKDEEADDIQKRDQCIEEYKNINSTISDLAWKIEVGGAKINKMQSSIDAKEAEKVATLEAIDEVNQNILSMNQTRTAENQAFHQAKLEDQQAIALLTQARDMLTAYYVKHNITLGPIQGLLQQGPTFEVHEDQAPEATFSHKGHRKSESKGIVSILTMLIQDLGGEVAVLVRDEAAAQLAYEAAFHAARTLRAELTAKKINLEQAISDTKDRKLTEEGTKATNEGLRTDEIKYREHIKPDCDWILGAFSLRREKRKAEMDGLVHAKQYLAGFQANEDDAALVQHGVSRLAPRAAVSQISLRSSRHHEALVA